MKYSTEQAHDEILKHCTDYFPSRDRSGKGWECPICHSGKGKNGTGISTKDGTHFTCWSGCFTNADIFEIYGNEHGITSYREQLRGLAEYFHIDVDWSSGSYNRKAAEDMNRNYSTNERTTQQILHNSDYTTQVEEDYTEFFRTAHSHVTETDYRRGLTLGTLDYFNVGYVAAWKHPKAKNAPATPRLIIPTSAHSYLARDTRADIPEAQKAYKKSKVGKVRVFNAAALEQDQSQPIFIVEGEIDAMSIYEVGGMAIGLGSIAYVNLFINLLKGSKTKQQQPFIIALDNDPEQATRDRVNAAVQKLESGLDEMGISHYRKDITGQHKDANEYLCADREGFTAAVQRAIAEVDDAETAVLEGQRDQLRQESVAFSLQSFLDNIEKSKTASYVSTGFPSIDNLLDGGLYAGLYIIGAISSLGKTTFCLQVADQIAAAGRDVLIFSLEMARDELISKSVSRLTYIADKEINGNTANAKTTRGILTGARYKYYSDTEKQLIVEAVQRYSQYARNIFITVGVGNVGVEQIREKVQNHVRIMGKAPVVLIDYLQIIAPADVRASDKQNTDKAVLELKRLSRDYGIPVIGISSFNRDNYTEPVNLTSFKESGAIEYSSDVLIGLQYEGMDYAEGESEKVRDKRIRELLKKAAADGKDGNAQHIQLKILKNRNGGKGDALLDFYPMFNCFTEREEEKEETANNDEDFSDWDKVSK